MSDTGTQMSKRSKWRGLRIEIHASEQGLLAQPWRRPPDDALPWLTLLSAAVSPNQAYGGSTNREPDYRGVRRLRGGAPSIPLGLWIS